MNWTERTIIIIACSLRLFFWFANPPNNAYDNHLEVVKAYSVENNVKPDKCWECYQPSVFYRLAEVIYSGSKQLGISEYNSWKAVQLINTLLSILVIVLFARILSLWSVGYVLKILLLSIWAVFPRDIFASAMITNDYMLVFIVVMVVYLLTRLFQEIEFTKKYYQLFFLICFLSAIAGLVKQSGLVMLIIPGLLWVRLITRKITLRLIAIHSLIVAVAILFGFSNEIDNIRTYDKFLVSNNDYFDYMDNQPPGEIENVEFLNFKFDNLISKPFLDESTLASFPTEIFARNWADYERRYYMDSWTGRLAARFGYVTGFLLFFLILILIIKSIVRKEISLKEYSKWLLWISFSIVILFFIVPVLQTIRYPAFSSMKAQFILPSIPLSLLFIGILLKDNPPKKWLIYSVQSILIVLAVFLVLASNEGLQFGLDKMSGPMWSFP
jgi:hypothetical protein